MACGRRMIDIAANLTDPMYKGLYNGSKKHEGDLAQVLTRAWAVGIEKILVTGTSLESSREAVSIAESDDRLFATAGCHPTEAKKWSNECGQALMELFEKDKLRKRRVLVAWGECGLDYDRLHFCPEDVQKSCFDAQLDLCKRIGVPLFLHCRAAFDDFIGMIRSHGPLKGVVHSFDGTLEQAEQFIQQGLYIGVNGCSLKTAENLQVVTGIPLDRLLLETDCPWCQVRPTHSSHPHVSTHFDSVKKEKWKPDAMIKGRNEPANIVQILEIVSSLKKLESDKVADQIYENTVELFFKN